MTVNAFWTVENKEQFHEQIAGQQLILLYPWMGYRDVYLSYVKEIPAERFLYHRVTESKLSLLHWLQRLQNDLVFHFSEYDHTPLERQLNTVETLSNENAQEIGKALAQSLASLPQTAVLFLDGLDNVTLDRKFDAFLKGVLEDLAAGVRLFLNARQLACRDWRMFLGFQPVTIGLEVFPESAHEPPNGLNRPHLEVYAFGRGRAYINGIEIPAWEGTLPRNLLYFLVDNRMVTRDEIFKTFWREMSIKDATNIFHVSKRKITEKLASLIKQPDCDFTQYQSGFYVPSKDMIRFYDVATFEEAISAAYLSEDDNAQYQLYRRALRLYSDDFLVGMDAEWIHERRNKLRGQLVDALIGMGRIHQQHNQSNAAIGYYTRAVRYAPNREDVHRSLMQLYRQQGRRDDAMAQYRQLTNYLDQTLMVAPARETVELYESIAKG